MKKTFLSFLLGAIVIASTSVFVSCQDYNDEVNGLSEQISTNKKAFEDQVAALNAEIGKLQAQHAADVKALNAADSTLAGLISKEVADAKAYALAEAQKAYDNAVKNADEAAQKARKHPCVRIRNGGDRHNEKHDHGRKQRDRSRRIFYVGIHRRPQCKHHRHNHQWLNH